MTRTPSSILRPWLALALIFPGLAAVDAVAQSVVAAAGVNGAASAAAAAGAASRATAARTSAIPSLAPAPGLTSAPLIFPAFTAPSAAPAAADGPTPLQEPLQPGSYWSPRADGPRGRELVPISSFEAPEATEGRETTRSRSARTFDGTAARRDLADGVSVAGSEGRAAAAPLAQASAAAVPTNAAVPAAPVARAGRGFSLALKIALGAALFLMAPAIAAAAEPVTAASTLGLLAAIRPAASAVGAVAGAVYGMIAARPKDGSEASSGEMFSSVLRYGSLGGAAVYMLLDVTSLAFIGPTASGGLQPISSAVVTAALGRTAFQGKFLDPATTSADRIVGAFPAVAAALGISLGVVGFVAPPLSVTLALGAMTITGVATALYAALFKLGRSPVDGPPKMAKGFVLQALMTGMALAVTSPYLFWIFAAMGAAGFGLTLWTMGRELLSFLPGRTAAKP